jgi:hypothetical protein
VIDVIAPLLSVTAIGGDLTSAYATTDPTPDAAFVTHIGDSVAIAGWTCAPTPATGTSVTCTPSTTLTEGAQSPSVTITDAVGNATL